MFRYIVAFLKIIAYIPFRLVFWTRTINRKELKKHRGKGVLFCCNHLSYSDAPTLYILFRRRLHFLVKPDLFKKKFWAKVFRDIAMYPVEKGKDLALVRHSMEVLKNNGALMMFPEGKRALSAEDALSLRNGAAMIAIKAGVPIVPIVFKRAPRPFVPNAIKVGEAISVDQYQGKKLEKSDLNELSGKIQTAMAGLLENFAVRPKQKWWEEVPSVIARGIVFANGKLLVVKRVKNGSEYFVFPGGHIDEGEIARDSAVREIKEETNITASAVRLLYKYKFEGDLSGYSNGMQSFYLCNYQSGEVGKTDAEEYSQENDISRGSYEPMLIELSELETVDLRPAAVKNQLIKDLAKYGTGIHKGAMFLED